MKLQKQISRIIDGTEYVKWVVVLPPAQIEKLGWREGYELESEIVRGSLILKPALESKEEERMAYPEFMRIIKEELEGVSEGLSWTEIRERRPEIYQKVPNNLWVRRLEEDLGIIREKVGLRTRWRLPK